MRLRTILILLVCGLFFISCARTECRSRAGKKKRKYYNSIQYR